MEQSSIPSPATEKIIKIKDEGISEYIEFPEDTFFMESLAHNGAFKSNIAYVPVQRRIKGKPDPESHVYTISPGMKNAKHCLGPVVVDGEPVTVFGSCLGSNGMLFLCAFNRNSILVYDMNMSYKEDEPAVPLAEIPNVPAPNDVAVDHGNNTCLYVAGGTIAKVCGCVDFSNAVGGKVYRVELNEKYTKGKVSVVADDFKTLAGVEVVGDDIWLAQLFNMVKLPKNGTEDPQVTWRGNDGNGQVWLADNIAVFDINNILCPAYSTIPEHFVKLGLKRGCLASAGSFVSQVFSKRKEGESLAEALADPEVALSFSNTFIEEGKDPAPIRIIIMNIASGKTRHFEVDLVEARRKNAPREIVHHETGEVLGKRHFFNEQVTHAAHLKSGNRGYIACINFEQPRILMLKDQPFRKGMSAP